MKTLVGHDLGSYTFAPGIAGVGTVALSLPFSITLDQVLLITNVAKGSIIFNFADSSKTATILNNVLTLAADTSAMSAGDALQIYIDIPTEETIYEVEPIPEKFTYDTNMAQVLGTIALGDGQGNLRTKSVFQTARVNGQLRIVNEEFSADCKGFQTAAIQLSGTFVGTVSFEAQANGGDWVAINGMATNGAAIVSSATAAGIFRFSVAGLDRIRARMSAYTSGAVIVVVALSGGEGVVAIGNVVTVAGTVTVQGSQTQNLSQKATTFELNTFDTNLATVLGAAALWRPGSLGTTDFPVAPSNPVQPASYVGNGLAGWPQRFPRLRVEAGGSEKLPFAQEPNTNRLMVANPEELTTLEQILIQLLLLNQNYAAVNGMALPSGQPEVR